jgi:hypothetical protein
MFWEDHPPPHFHASTEIEALINILTAEIIADHCH